MISSKIFNNIGIIQNIFLIIDLTISLYLINDNKNLNLLIKKIPFDDYEKYKQFLKDKKEL